MCVGFIRREVLPHYFKIVLRIAVSCLFNRTFSNVKMNVKIGIARSRHRTYRAGANVRKLGVNFQGEVCWIY